MTYHMHIKSEEAIVVSPIINPNLSINLVVGNKYVISIEKPSNIRDKKNNGRVVELLGFTDSLWTEPIVKYLDNGRRGKAHINCLLPYKE